MTTTTYVFLKGLPAPVDLTGCPDVVALLPEILTYWPFEISAQNANKVSPFFVVRPHKSGFMVGSPHFDKPKTYPDAVNTMCALVAELAWEQVRTDASLLCIHAAALEFNGRLLLIPNKRRAGKSTLTAALAARGHRVFTDDFLPLAVNEDGRLCGVACGIAPRLRLPLPEGFGDEGAAFVNINSGPANQQYKYLKLGSKALASKGEMLPIGGIMVLNRDDKNELTMTQPEIGDVLRTLITQNFAREMKSGGILRSLEFLVSNAKCQELSYSNVEQTLDLIEQKFKTWECPVSRFDIATSGDDFTTANMAAKPDNVVSFQTNEPLQQSPGVTIRDMGNKKFLSDQNGLAIHQLNETSAAIWQLLNEPTSLSELAEIFRHAFPENDPAAMCEDIRQTLRHMSKAGLVQPSKGTALG